MSLTRLALLVLLALSLMSAVLGCDVEVEGDETGECSDGTDNDQDGARDCDDEGCAIDLACEGDDDSSVGIDADGDGFSEAEGDCDDSNAALNPMATDIVGDDIDQNCDGVDGTDVDGDGYAGSGTGGTDCDDDDDSMFPNAAEIGSDGIDQDCNGYDELGGEIPCSESPDATGSDIGDVLQEQNIIVHIGQPLLAQTSLHRNCGNLLLLVCSAMWSSPDHMLLSELEDLQAAYGSQGLQILQLWVDGPLMGSVPTWTDVEGMIAEHGITYPQAIDGRALCPELIPDDLGGGGAFPTLLFIRPGSILDRIELGYSEEYAAVIEALLPQ